VIGLASRTAWLRRDPALAALGVLLILGLAARVYFVLVWRPAITGYSDSGIYFQDAYAGVWSDPLRTVGYGMFLAALHWVTPHLLLVTIVQHTLGLGSAALWFFTLRRIGAPPLLGLVPAAILALGGDELFIEHAALSETVYIFLLTLMLYSAVRARNSSLRWAAVAGLCAGLGVWDRGAGIALLPVIPLWLLFSGPWPSRLTAGLALVSLIAAVATVGVYIEWRHLASGRNGLTTNGNWNLYGRVAPWADCTKFKPPAGTAGLCDPTPPAQRAGRNAEYYIYSPASPAQRLFGPPFAVSAVPDAMTRLRQFSVAAIEGQPGDYLNAVWQDTVRLMDPNHPSAGDLSADVFIAYMLNGIDLKSGTTPFVESWRTREYPHDRYHRGSTAALKQWEQVTRFDGPWMVLLLALCLLAPWVVLGEARSAARLLAAVTLILLLFPEFTKGYDYRFVIPAFGPLFATAALSGWGLGTRVRRWRRARLRG
jgi:hypothetical protein